MRRHRGVVEGLLGVVTRGVGGLRRFHRRENTGDHADNDDTDEKTFENSSHFSTVQGVAWSTLVP